MISLKDAEGLMLVGEYQKAKEILLSLLEEDPHNLKAISHIGIVYTELGENSQAVRSLKHYLQFVQNDAQAWEALGCACFRQKDYGGAYRNLRRAQDLENRNPSILRNLGVLYGVRGQKELGYELLLQSYELQPGDFRTLYALSYIHKEFNKKDDALKCMETLLEMNIPEEIHRDTLINKIYLELNW
ncbi:MAG: tetratricopeptide repeat protein [Spirochaetaceae bacterium]|jgi:Flp pilus assembly protein TadD|nr:tetratricopeptide repeat protein [Spirochaetaceae bacterium]